MSDVRVPFHEAVIGVLNHASGFGLMAVGELLRNTVIPKDHDKIIWTWERRCQDTNLDPLMRQLVIDSIKRHKKEIEEKENTHVRDDGWSAGDDFVHGG
jgi:hypothetical protein